MKIRIPNKILLEKDNIIKLEVHMNVPDRDIKYNISTKHIKANYDFLFVDNAVFNVSTGITFVITYENNDEERIVFPDKYRCEYLKNKPLVKEHKSLLRTNKDVIYADTQEDKQLIMSIVDVLYDTALEIPDNYLGNKNLIYFTVAKSTGYLNLLELSLKTLHRQNPIKNFDVLIITTSDFKLLIEQKEIAKKFNLLFHVVDEPQDGVRASMLKLNVFDFPELHNYRNILFLDCDIVCIKPIKNLFVNKLKTNNLLTVSNPSVPITSHNSIYHGLDVEDPERIQRIIDNKQMPFNAGQFMFKNSERMKQHFENVKWFASVWPGKFFFEQCFMNRYFCGFNLTDNTKLKDAFIITSSSLGNTQHKVHNEESVFIHFTSPPLDADAKLTFITDYCNAHQLPI